MVIGIVGIVIGIMVLAAGIYYLIKEKTDKESRKIYGIISAIGAVVEIASIVVLSLNL